MNKNFSWKWNFISVLLLMIFAFFVSCQAQDAGQAGNDEISADLLMPETACAYFLIRDYPELVKEWEKTQWGRMLRIPEMKAARESIQEQLESRCSQLTERLGVSPAEIFEIASGEIAGGLLLISPQKYATAVIVDVHDRQVETQQVLKKIVQRVEAGGGKHVKQNIVNAEVHFLDIVTQPKKQDTPAKKTSAAPAKAAQPTTHKAIYVLKDNRLIVSDDADTIRGILQRMGALSSDSEQQIPCLGEVAGYWNVLEQCMGDSDDENRKLPDIVWYIDPVRFMTAMHLVHEQRQESKDSRTRNPASTLTATGFDGVEAVGGFFTLNTEGYECMFRIFASIPQPATKSLKMLNFPAGNDFTPPAWVPAEVGGCNLLNANFLTVFDNIGPLFNQLYGEGDDQVWADVLDGLKEDPYGPQVDLREDIAAYLGKNILIFTQNKDPEALDGERRMIAIPLTDSKKVLDSVTRLLDKEDGIQTQKMPDGRLLWYYADPKNAAMFGKEKKQGGRGQFFPDMTITVCNDYLIFSSHRDYLKDFDFQAKGKKSLAETKEYKNITAELNKFVGKSRSSQFFENSEIQYRHIYEMFRNGTIPESQSVCARVINRIFTEPDSTETRKSLLDAKLLPDYETLRPYFAPAGSALTHREKGILLEGVFLSAKEDAGKEKVKAPAEKTPPAVKTPAEKTQPAAKTPAKEGKTATKTPAKEGKTATKTPAKEGKTAAPAKTDGKTPAAEKKTK